MYKYVQYIIQGIRYTRTYNGLNITYSRLSTDTRTILIYHRRRAGAYKVLDRRNSKAYFLDKIKQ